GPGVRSGDIANTLVRTWVTPYWRAPEEVSMPWREASPMDQSSRRITGDSGRSRPGMTAVTFHVFDPEKPDQDAIRGGDERVSAALLLEVLGHRAHLQIWSE